MSEQVVTASVPTGAPSSRYRSYVLAMLVVVYTFNFIDRQILSILAPAIKADLGLTDSELGLLHGLAFAILYSTLGVPIAFLADRASRRRIMAWALGIWSGFTALCGLATGFWHLFLARVGVGIGEAGGVAPAYSMIADYFPKAQRARALSIYSLGIPIGSGCGILFMGLLASEVDWRVPFVVVGALGVVLAPIFRFTVRDPRRGGYEAAPSSAHAPAPAARFGEVVRLVGGKPTFWLLAFGAASASVCSYGLAFWLPSFFMRSFGLDLAGTSWFYGGLTFLGGCLGIYGGGVLADRLGRRSRAAYPRIPALAFLVGLPCFFLAIDVGSLPVAFVLFLVPLGLNLVWLGPVLTAVQHLVPAHMRTTASAMFLMINNLFGIAVGSYYFGAMADLLAPRYGADALRYAIYTGLGFYLVASTLLFLASRRIARDWVE